MIEISCQQCGKPCVKPTTQSWPQYLKKRKFCSRECKDKDKIIKTRKKWAERKCKACGKGFDKGYLKAYCSNKCFHRINIPDQELIAATKVWGGMTTLAEKYGISAAAISIRCKKLLTRLSLRYKVETN